MSEKWKEFNNAEVILQCLPYGKEWEALEYFAENNYPVFINLINLHGIASPFSRKKVLEHYKDANLEELEKTNPNLVKYIFDSLEYIKGLSENGRKTGEYLKNLYAERKKNFLDSSGHPMKFFTISKEFPVFTKEACFEVANFFMETGLSAAAFCSKFEIDNLEGFRDAMSRVALNDENFKTYYEDLKTSKQNAYIALCRKTIEDIANGTMGVAELIESHNDSTTLPKLVDFANALFDDKQILDRFVFNVLSYYQERVNSYNDSFEPENIKKMLSYKEVSFILGSDTIKTMKTGKVTNPSQVLRQTLTPYGKDLKSITIHRMFNNARNSLGYKLGSYDNLFNKKSYLSQNPHQLLLDGSTVPISGDIIDMSKCFATQNQLFQSYSTITKLNRSILNGKLDYSAETEAYKEALKNQIVVDYSQCKTIEEYLTKKSQYQKEQGEE